MGKLFEDVKMTVEGAKHVGRAMVYADCLKI
jgi:hypothetical protein